jgi:hypothetical protein
MLHMRTTLDIDDAVLAAAKEIAEAEKSSAGAIISALARKGLAITTGRNTQRKSGFPIFSVPASACPLTSATVKSLLTDEGLPS